MASALRVGLWGWLVRADAARRDALNAAARVGGLGGARGARSAAACRFARPRPPATKRLAGEAGAKTATVAAAGGGS